MKIKKLAFCLSMVATLTLSAQEKKSFTLDDLIPGGTTYSQHTPKSIATAWWGDVAIENGISECKSINPKNGARKVLFTLDDVNEALKSEGIKEMNTLTRATFPVAKLTQVMLKAANRIMVVDWKTKKVVWNGELPQGAENCDHSPANIKDIAFTKAHNLYVLSDGKTLCVSNDGSNDIVYGESVHRNEFGIEKGTFWSPDGKLLAFYRMDQSMVPDYPQVNISTRIASLEPDKYPMAGEKSHKVTIGVFNPSTNNIVWLKAGDPTDRYFTNISWSADSKMIYVIELNRDQNHAELVEYDALTGNRGRVLFEERNEKYVEPQNPLTFLPWNPNQFIYQSQKDGYNHLYIYNTDGKLIKQLTSGKWVVAELIGFNKKQKSVIIKSNELSPIQMNLFSVDVATGKRSLLDSGTGVHRAKLSASGNSIIDSYSDENVPLSINLVSTEKKNIRNIHSAEDPWKEFNAPEITGGTIKAADGLTNLYYRLTKPTNFDENKKYPTVIYVYGGPHAHNVDASFHHLSRGWEVYMAQLGYVVFVLDNRGSENRGFEFESTTFRHLGVEEMKDQMEGVKFLKSLPYVDAERLGVHGWSFGGFMTTNLMLTYPDVFKVGVAGGPVIDWKYYEVMYGERYMDSPQTNPEGYKGSNLNEKAGNLKGRLMIIYGGNDPTCVPQHSLSFIRSCIDKGTHPDLFTYPGDGHNMMGTDRIHLHEHITRYFEDFLK